MRIPQWLAWPLLALVIGMGAYISVTEMRWRADRAAIAAASPDGRGAPFALLMNLDSLSVRDRIRLRRQLIARLPDMRRAASDTREAGLEFAKTFEAETFDPVEADAAAYRFGEARQRQWALTSSVVIQLIESLPDDARLELARRRADLRNSGTGFNERIPELQSDIRGTEPTD